MRCIMGICFVLAVATAAWANETGFAPQQLAPPPPGVRTLVPNIQAPGAAAVPTPATTVQPGTAATTVLNANAVAVQGGATTSSPTGNTTYYYYYPAGNSSMRYQANTPGTYYYYSTGSAPFYTNPTQTYYTTGRRGFPFGLFRRRFVQPAYTTAAVTPTYYSSPTYYYTPTTFTMPPATAPAGTYTGGVISPGTTAPVYTPTTYTVPNGAMPAGSTTSSGATIPTDTTAPSGVTAPSGATTSSGTGSLRVAPPPPPVNPR
jgi:hypothetical protein